jgi:hypothetical protein
MLIITIELIPGGIGSRKTIGTLRIGNMSDLADVSDYRIVAMEAANPITGKAARIADETLRDHDRRQSVWKIVEGASKAIEHADWGEL